MKIGTWNIERLKKRDQNEEILNEINSRNFDILVLTEYDERIKPVGFDYQISTEDLMSVNTDNYLPTERRVKIFSKYKIVKQFDTFNKFTSCCAEVETDYGNLVIYGTIIGIYGNRNQNFKDDLQNQILDFNTIAAENNICIIGDYNMSFSDNYYFTKFGRETINNCFKELKIKNLTVELPENIDHIAISESFLDKTQATIETWNLDKRLSDHIGISIEIH